VRSRHSALFREAIGSFSDAVESYVARLTYLVHFDAAKSGAAAADSRAEPAGLRAEPVAGEAPVADEAPVGLPVETDVPYCAQPWDSLAAEPGALAGLRAEPVGSGAPAGEALVGLLVAERKVPCCARPWNYPVAEHSDALADAERCYCEAVRSLS
jgi:hypothetical protein